MSLTALLGAAALGTLELGAGGAATPATPGTVEPPVGHVAVVGLAPAIGHGVTITPPIGAISLAGLVPLVAGAALFPPRGAASVAGLAPALSIGITILPPVGAISVRAIVPIRINDLLSPTVFPPVANVIVLGLEPEIRIGAGIAPPVGAVSVLGLVPSVSLSRSIHDLLGWPTATLVPVCRVTIGGSYSQSGDTTTRPGAHAYQGLSYDDTGAISLRVTEAEIRIGMGVGALQPATARVVLPETAVPLDPAPTARLPLLIDLGYLDSDGTPLYERVFTGETAALGKAYWPFTQTLQGVGFLGRVQLPLKEHTTISDLAEWDAARQLLDRAGVLAWDVDGLEDHLGVQHDLVVGENTPPGQLLGGLDSQSLYLTHDAADGVTKRRRIPGVAGIGLDTTSSALLSDHWAAGAYAILDGAERSFDASQVRNRVKVLGWIPDDPLLERSEHTRHNSSPFVDTPPTYVTHSISSDTIEFDILAKDLCQAQMRYRNRQIERWRVPTRGNPYLRVGTVVDLLHVGLGLNPGDSFTVFEVSHHYSTTPPVWRTELVCESATVAVSGSQEDTHPVASFSFSVSGPDVNGFYTVTCDGSGSYDSDSTDSNLDFAWENDQTAATLSGSGVTEGGTYVVVFDAAQWAAGPSVSLTVTDADRLRSTLWQRVDL